MRSLGPESLLFRYVAGLLSPAGTPASLLILIYHHVLGSPDPMNDDEPDAAAFAAQLDVVKQVFNVLPLSEAVARLRSGDLPSRALCITFDDGYENNRSMAAPLLAERGLVATFFVASGYLNSGRMWNDTVVEAIRRAPDLLDLSSMGLQVQELPDMASRRKLAADLLGRFKYLPMPERLAVADRLAETVGAELPQNLMMKPHQVKELLDLGMEIGGHTVSHPILANVTLDEARHEIEVNRRELEEITGAPVRCFAYPNGRPGKDYCAAHAAMVRDVGYEAAVSTTRGAARTGSDLFQLPRVSSWDRSIHAYALRLLRVYVQGGG